VKKFLPQSEGVAQHEWFTLPCLGCLVTGKPP
jgi:hypothetical protein